MNAITRTDSRKIGWRMNKKSWLIILLLTFAAVIFAQNTPLPTITLSAARAENPQETVTAIQIFVLLTILTLAPSILIMCTCFTRIIIIFHFLKQAIGIQQMPPNQIIIGLALFLTFFIMSPTFNKVYQDSYVPYSQGKISQDTAFTQTSMELKKFMLRQTGEKELGLFLELNKGPQPKTALDIPLLVAVPAFVLSEIRIAFQVGFILYLPFIIIDMVIASILMSMGMMMLPPMMISLPFKILLFILVDGWYLLVESIVNGYR